jgi:hypothetical protein
MCFLCHEVHPGGMIHFVSRDLGYAHASCLATAYFAAQARLANVERERDELLTAEHASVLRAERDMYQDGYQAAIKLLDELRDALAAAEAGRDRAWTWAHAWARLARRLRRLVRLPRPARNDSSVSSRI